MHTKATLQETSPNDATCLRPQAGPDTLRPVADWYPLLFADNYRTALWGGDRIARTYGHKNAPACCSESWEVSAHPSAPCYVANGAFAGRSLTSLVAEFGAELTGTDAPNPYRFPLLFKVIDARERLSLQVHPGMVSVVRTGGEPKSEMWYVLDATPCCTIFAGLRPGVTEEELRQHARDGNFSAVANPIPVLPGEIYSIPGGLVHSIGAGALIYEVQQSSDTTYRLSDWGRVGADGKPRELHLEKGLASIDYSLPVPQPLTSVENGFFSFHVHDLLPEETRSYPADARTFRVIFVAEGAVKLTWAKGELLLACGTSVLIPAPLAYRTSCAAFFFGLWQ